MKKPYLMTKEEWLLEKEKTSIKHGQLNYTKSSKNEEIQRLKRLEYLLFDIGKWLYDKAFTEEWALDAIDSGIYDRYDMIILKAKEEGLI